METELLDTQAALLPGTDDVAFYREHGYWVSPVMLPGDVLDDADAAMRRFYDGARDHTLPDTPGTRGWQPEDGKALRKNDYASLRMEGLARLVRHPLIGASAAILSGALGIRLWHDQLLYKPADTTGTGGTAGTAHTPTLVGWHTDRQYWLSCSSERMLTAWVGFHDVDEQGGAVSFLPGSHRWDVSGLDFFSQDAAALEDRLAQQGFAVRPVTPPLRRGQVTFHHCRTVHGSGPNRGTGPRRSLAIHLQPDDNHWQRVLKADGQSARHANDDLVRAAQGVPDYSDPAICPQLWPAKP